MLEYYEQVLGFDTVELNFTYYRMPSPQTLTAMVRRTSPGFTFVVRSHKEMTHDIWTDDSRRKLKDTTTVFNQFWEGLQPLTAAGRLGCVLVQFPVFFWPSPQNREYLTKLPVLLPDIPLVVEFRNRAWLSESTFALLEQTALGYCVVDEPKLPRLMPFEPRRTAATAYFRFHGRNPDWFTAGREERYNYLYSTTELQEFVEPVRSLSSAGTTFLFFNNCHAGAAARNALMMKRLLGLIDELTLEQRALIHGVA